MCRGNSGSHNINGGVNYENETLFNGVPVTFVDYAGNQTYINPPYEAVDEFRVNSSTFNAQYGLGQGAVTFNMASGTNQFHGDAWEFFRNSSLDANNFFANRSGASLPEFQQNQFGFTAGGPIKKDKTFFFGSYEGFRQRIGGQTLLTVPTALEKAGDFSQTFRPDGSLYTIYNPFTTRPDPATGGFLRDPFPGNTIPSSMFDPVASKLLQYFPNPNLLGDPITHANNFESQAGSSQGINTWMVRIDHQLAVNQRIMGRFIMSNQTFNPANVLGNIADFNANPFMDHDKGFVLAYTNSLNATTLLNVRYGLVRQYQLNKSLSQGFDITTLGFPASLKAQLESPVFPRFDISGFTSLGTQFFTLTDRANTTQSLAASLSKVIGRHSIQAGTELQLIQGALYQPGWPSGQFTFDPGFTNGPDPTLAENNGSSFASFLLGTTGGGEVSYDPHWFFTQPYYAFYVQDDVKASKKLTLNLGLRWNYESPLSDRHNQLSFVDMKDQIPLKVAPVDLGPGIGSRPQLPLVGGGAGFPGINGIGKGVTESVWHDWAPRVGLAYALTPNTVIRGAYGILWAPTTADNSGNFPTITGFNPQTYIETSPNGLNPFDLPDRAFLLSNPFPNGLIPVTGSSQGLLTNVGNSDSGFVRNDNKPYIQQWNFGVQRQLPGNMMVEVSYAGSHGVDLLDYSGGQFNALPDKYLALGNSLFNSVPNPFYGVVPSNTTLGVSNTTTLSNMLLPYPEFPNGVTGQGIHNESTTYNAAEFKAEKRTSHGLSFLASYTISKALDSDSSTDGADINGTLPGQPYVTGPQDLNNLRLDHSLSAQDVSQLVVLSPVYELPFGKGKLLGSNLANPVASRVISGWQMSSVVTFATGFPLGVLCSACSYPANRPNLVGNPKAGISGSDEARLNEWVNPSAFALNIPFSYGTAPRTLPNMRGPGQANTDFALVKNTRFSERYSAQFRAEFFNIFNRPRFGMPDMSFGDTTFGEISNQVNDPREIQFALKFYW